MPIYTLGMEYYRNESGKELGGTPLLRIDSKEASFEHVKAHVSALLIEVQTAVREKMENPLLPEVFKLRGLVYDQSSVLTGMFAKTRLGFDRIYAIIKSDTYWYHLFLDDEMAKQRKSMFDNSKELSENLEERSFEDIMGNAVDLSNETSLTFTQDAFFNKEGVELNGLPDFWQVQAGLY